MKANFYVSRIQISPRRILEGINCGFDIDTVKATTESVWQREYSDAKVIAIRPLDEHETKTVEEGWNVWYYPTPTATPEQIEQHDQWLTTHYKKSRSIEWGEEYNASLHKSHREDFIKYGYDLISHHDSNTGQAEFFPDYETFKRLMRPA